MYFVEKDTESKRKAWVIKKRNGTKIGTLPIFLALSSFLESAISLPGERFLEDVLSFWQLKPRDRFLTQLSSSTVLGLPVLGTQAWLPSGHQFHGDYTTGVLCQRTGNVQVFQVPDTAWGMVQGYPKELAPSWGNVLLSGFMHTQNQIAWKVNGRFGRWHPPNGTHTTECGTEDLAVCPPTYQTTLPRHKCFISVPVFLDTCITCLPSPPQIEFLLHL